MLHCLPAPYPWHITRFLLSPLSLIDSISFSSVFKTKGAFWSGAAFKCRVLTSLADLVLGGSLSSSGTLKRFATIGTGAFSDSVDCEMRCSKRASAIAEVLSDRCHQFFKKFRRLVGGMTAGNCGRTENCWGTSLMKTMKEGKIDEKLLKKGSGWRRFPFLGRRPSCRCPLLRTPSSLLTDNEKGDVRIFTW